MEASSGMTSAFVSKNASSTRMPVPSSRARTRAPQSGLVFPSETSSTLLCPCSRDGIAASAPFSTRIVLISQLCVIPHSQRNSPRKRSRTSIFKRLHPSFFSISKRLYRFFSRFASGQNRHPARLFPVAFPSNNYQAQPLGGSPCSCEPWNNPSFQKMAAPSARHR